VDSNLSIADQIDRKAEISRTAECYRGRSDLIELGLKIRSDIQQSKIETAEIEGQQRAATDQQTRNLLAVRIEETMARCAKLSLEFDGILEAMDAATWSKFWTSIELLKTHDPIKES
jgi:hypothetical protein